MATMMEVTPLGDAGLLFYTMHAREELSRLFEYQLDLLSLREDVDVDAVLGKNLTVKMSVLEDETR